VTVINVDIFIRVVNLRIFVENRLSCYEKLTVVVAIENARSAVNLSLIYSFWNALDKVMEKSADLSERTSTRNVQLIFDVRVM
jgi:hypothetical protein